ncbi:uncharacterized protein LOC127848952 [Dreissena polymorpha]|uniref:uncharacterized protein LOC127848952 n=1 Tax=Dreissena polymorpha TaxID=45954 RepID=UPI002265526C|nr:uncharacterized protein LOC127848952 [Dreissena polymorpha]
METDGASVITGNKSGVVERVRQYTNRPFIFTIHCSAHRLLAYKDGLKDIKAMTPQKRDALLLNLYLFYKYSPLNRANLKASLQTLDLKMKIPNRVGGTRWLPHTKKAIDHVLYGYNAIIQHQEQIQNPSDAAHRKDSAAKGNKFLKLLKDSNVTFWLHALMDIVSALSQVSEAIQVKNISLADVWNEILSAISIWKNYKSRY